MKHPESRECSQSRETLDSDEEDEVDGQSGWREKVERLERGHARGEGGSERRGDYLALFWRRRRRKDDLDEGDAGRFDDDGCHLDRKPDSGKVDLAVARDADAGRNDNHDAEEENAAVGQFGSACHLSRP